MKNKTFTPTLLQNKLKVTEINKIKAGASHVLNGVRQKAKFR